MVLLLYISGVSRILSYQEYHGHLSPHQMARGDVCITTSYHPKGQGVNEVKCLCPKLSTLEQLRQFSRFQPRSYILPLTWSDGKLKAI